MKGYNESMEKEFETTVIDTIQRTHDIKSFRFSCPEDADFKPGQFFILK
jgi:ferredoxin-NADP reductase